MAKYAQSVMTNAGIDLARRAMDSEITLEFTRIASGDGTYSSSEDLKERTALINQLQNFGISSREVLEDNTLHLKGIISNVNEDGTSLTTGYSIREVGLFAKASTDTSDTLFAIAVSDDNPDYIPQYDSLQPATVTEDFYVTVSNTANVTVTSDPSAYAAATDLQKLTDRVATDETSYKALIDTNAGNIATNKTNIANAQKNWTVSLPASGWSSAYPYTQTVTVSGMLASYAPVWGVKNAGATVTDAKAINHAAGFIQSITTGSGNITVTCIKLPTVDLTLMGKGV